MNLEAIRAKRAKQGLNVRFVNQAGREDVASFRTKERADWFRKRCARAGLKVLN